MLWLWGSMVDSVQLLVRIMLYSQGSTEQHSTGLMMMTIYSYTIRCASTGNIIIADADATDSDIRAYRRQFASPLHYGRMVDTVVELIDIDDSECF
jgi:hypothetical protein